VISFADFWGGKNVIDRPYGIMANPCESSGEDQATFINTVSSRLSRF
jgi:hypothetical protein